jgi:hypothetical protein
MLNINLAKNRVFEVFMLKYKVTFFTLFLFFLSIADVQGSTSLEDVSAKITITHISPETWLVQYQLSQPVETIKLGPKILDYRESSWEILSKDVVLESTTEGEVLQAKTGTFSQLKIKVNHFSDYSMDNYAPSARFSDGGIALYAEFLFGDVIINKQIRELKTNISYRTNLKENIITDPKMKSDIGVYTYFGPQVLKQSGDVRIIIDPNMPEWLKKSFNKVVPIVSKIFSKRLNHQLSAMPQVMLASGDINTMDSFSVKGGAKNNQLVMIYKGKELLQPSKEKQHMIERLIAHEMAHLWQQDVTNGGMSAKEPWIHEGGAEVLAVEALIDAKLWNKDYRNKYTAYYTNRCTTILEENTLQKKIEEGNWDAVYACGYRNLVDLKVNPFDLWAFLIDHADKTGAHFSSNMLTNFSNKLTSKEGS